MKFICAVEINAPINLVVKVFEDPKQQKYFQDGFISKVHLSGEIGCSGSKSKITFEKLELIESIIENNLPNHFFALYEHKHMTNTMKVKFSSINSFKTHYSSEIEYTKFNILIIKILAKLFPGLFKKQVQKWLNQFKIYVESQYANNQSQT